MLTLRNPADLARALEGAMHPQLRALLTMRSDHDAASFLPIIVAQRGDSLDAIQSGIGRVDLKPSRVRRHGCWLEGAFASPDATLFSPDRIDISPAILRLLRA